MVDKYGRVLAEIWIVDNDNETNLNWWLCENHFAVPYEGQNKNDIIQAHLKNREICWYTALDKIFGIKLLLQYYYQYH